MNVDSLDHAKTAANQLREAIEEFNQAVNYANNTKLIYGVYTEDDHKVGMLKLSQPYYRENV